MPFNFNCGKPPLTPLPQSNCSERKAQQGLAGLVVLYDFVCIWQLRAWIIRTYCNDRPGDIHAQVLLKQRQTENERGGKRRTWGTGWALGTTLEPWRVTLGHWRLNLKHCVSITYNGRHSPWMRGGSLWSSGSSPWSSIPRSVSARGSTWSRESSPWS